MPKIDFETGMKDGLPPQAQPEGGVVLVSESERRRLANLERLQHIIDRAMKGELPRDRELRKLEVDKLSEVHIQMILDRAGGMTTAELTEKYDYHPTYINVILNHPDAQTVLSTILSLSADRLTDMNERLTHLAPEALNIKVELMRMAKTETLRDKAASDILALAGYGGKTGATFNINSNNKGPTIVMPASQAKGLVNALAEAQRVASVDYSQYLAGSKGEVIAAEHRQLSDGQQIGPGQIDSEGGASPSPSSEPGYETIQGFKVAAAEVDAFRSALEDEREEKVA